MIFKKREKGISHHHAEGIWSWATDVLESSNVVAGRYLALNEKQLEKEKEKKKKARQ